MAQPKHGFALVLLWVSSVLVLAAASSSFGQAPRHNRHHQHMEKHHVPKAKAEGGSGVLKDTQLLQDKEHLQEDLEHVLSAEQIKSMTPDELEYHYFKVHDFDNNNKLDGLEFMIAISHVVTYEDEDHGIDVQHLSAAEAIIDEVFSEGDRNNDGYLSYSEYRYQRRQNP